MVKPSFRHAFPKAIAAILCIFFGLMIAVTVGAYSRKSGNTGLDMAKIQQLRSPEVAEAAEPAKTD